MKKNNNIIREIHIPKAENVRYDTNKRLVIDWIDKIEKAKLQGETHCYVSASSGGVTKFAVQKFLDAGYDLYYNHFMFDSSWFITAHWEDGCCGRIYSQENRSYVTIEQMFAY